MKTNKTYQKNVWSGHYDICSNFHLKYKKLHNVWAAMKYRCNTKTCHAYERYGGRGISVCDEWHDFTDFLFWAVQSGYSAGLEIDRVDNNGNYEPSNCKWSSKREQARNRGNKSKYGSCIYRAGKKFMVKVYKSKHLHYLGAHESVELAELIRDEFLGGYAH